MLNHGINTYMSDTKMVGVKTASVGIPFFIGAWPCHAGKGFAGKPQIIYSFAEAKELGGFSYDWRNTDGSPKWSLCQAMYSQFRLFGMAPAVVYNVFDPTKHKKDGDIGTVTVVNHTMKLASDVIANDKLVVKYNASALVKDKDYEIYYTETNCVIELLEYEGNTAYDAETLEIECEIADFSQITKTDIEAAVEKIEECKTIFGIVPDLICAPGWSYEPSVAAVMAAKADSVNGLYHVKAVVDVDTRKTTGARSYTEVNEWKSKNGYTDPNEIVLWPMVKVGDYIFDYSVYVCGKIAEVDAGNGGVPYESPSNKNISISGLCLNDGTEVTITLPQADVVSVNAGIVTAINNGGWVTWGNYTGCYPISSDVAEYFICCNRMFDFVRNTFVDTYWSYVDKPLSRIYIDAIINSFNSWLSGLTHNGYIYGGEVRYVPAANPTADLLMGKFRLDLSMASPVPMQQINLWAEYDVSYMEQALNAEA